MKDMFKATPYKYLKANLKSTLLGNELETNTNTSKCNKMIFKPVGSK